MEPDIFEVDLGSSVELVCVVDSDIPGMIPQWKRATGLPLPPQAEVSSRTCIVTVVRLFKSCTRQRVVHIYC